MLDKYAIWRALETVLSNPTKRFSIVGLAKVAKMAPSAAKYCLEYMLKRGLIKLEIIGRTHQYQVNTDSYLTRQWKVLLSLEEIKDSKIIENILKTRKTIISILLYGSTASGRDDENSDIDILVIADTNTEGKNIITALAKDTKREPNISIYTPEEWRKKATTDKIFYDKAIIDSIILYGEKPVVL
ncbi:nucleotidyltransferase domain-containing protein [Candidatus Micrarchaeota archaeon]|nr:nucleotidyltransferase domain-containing protein [Candidatus Micrarchaeota archaeon]